MATKPDPRAFLATLKDLKAAPESCVLVDDTESNVRGARDVGIDAIQFVSARALDNELHQRQLLWAARTHVFDGCGHPSLPESNRATLTDMSDAPGPVDLTPLAAKYGISLAVVEDLYARRRAGAQMRNW
jgi:FMN phosphatase YigB (HAD superfamily)